MIQRTPTPERIVDDHGRVTFGVFRDPLRNIDLDRTRLRKAGLPLPRAAVRFRLKEWQHYCLDLGDVFATFALVDSKFLRVSWCHVVDRRSGRCFEHGRQSPTLKMRLADALYDDRCRVHARGYSIEVDNALDRGEHLLRIHIAAAANRPAVDAELRCLHDLGVVRSVFHQPHGTFEGRVTTPDGDLEISGLYGVCEDHDAKW